MRKTFAIVMLFCAVIFGALTERGSAAEMLHRPGMGDPIVNAILDIRADPTLFFMAACAVVLGRLGYARHDIATLALTIWAGSSLQGHNLSTAAKSAITLAATGAVVAAVALEQQVTIPSGTALTAVFAVVGTFGGWVFSQVVPQPVIE